MADDEVGAVFTLEFENGKSLKKSTTEVNNKIKSINKEIKKTQNNFKTIFSKLNVGSSNKVLKVFEKINKQGFNKAIKSVNKFQDELVRTKKQLKEIQRLTGGVALGGGVGRGRRRVRGGSINETLVQARATLVKQRGDKVVSGIRRDTAKISQMGYKNKVLETQADINKETAKFTGSKTEHMIAKSMTELARAMSIEAKSKQTHAKTSLIQRKADSINPELSQGLQQSKLNKAKAEERLKEQQIFYNEQRALIQKVKYEVFLKNQALRDKKRETLEAQRIRDGAWHRRMGRGIKGAVKRQASNITGAGIGFALFKAGQVAIDTTKRLGQEQAVAGQSNANEKDIRDMLNMEERGQQKTMNAVRKGSRVSFTKESRQEVSSILSKLADLTVVAQKGIGSDSELGALSSFLKATGTNSEALRGRKGSKIYQTMLQSLLNTSNKNLISNKFINAKSIPLLRQSLESSLSHKEVVDNKAYEALKQGMNALNELNVKTTNLVITGLTKGKDIVDFIADSNTQQVHENKFPKVGGVMQSHYLQMGGSNG